MLNSKRYLKEFGGSMLAYVLVVVVTMYLLNAFPEASWRPLAALLPVLPVIFALMAVIRGVKELDELQQRVQLMAVSASFIISGTLTLAYGFLELAGAPPLNTLFIFPAMVMLWGICTSIFSRSYA